MQALDDVMEIVIFILGDKRSRSDTYKVVSKNPTEKIEYY